MDFRDIIPAEIECTSKVRKQIIAKVKAFAELADDLPVFIIHELSTGNNQVVYMSPKGLEELGITLEVVREMGPNYYKLFFNEKDTINYLSKWNEFSENYKNKGVWFTYFQQVNIVSQNKPIWFLSASTVVAYDDEIKKPLFSITISLRIHQYMPIVPKLERLVSENHFLKENLNLFSSLTKKEKEILRLMAMGMTPKEIADQTSCSEQTARTHRRNIKRKLQIKKEVDLVYFAQAFNLV